MLSQLDIRDILIIDRLVLDFRPGLNVLTGETGAGKSILLDALGFVLGWRGRAEIVRTGAERGEVTAVFDIAPDHPAQAVLEEAGFAPAREVILRRVNTPDGRKTAWVNDRRVSGEVLRALSDRLVELHGQQDDRGLLNPRAHRDLLDTYGDHGPLLAELRAAWRARGEAAKALAAAEERLRALTEEEDFLRHAAGELDDLAPEPGEDAQLDAARRRIRAGEKIREDVARAAAALGPDGAEGRVSDATRWLEDAAGSAEGLLDEALDAVSRSLTELGEAQDAIRRAAEAMGGEPGALERIEDRLFAIRALARKHGVAPDALADLAGEFRARLQSLDDGAAGIAALRNALAAAEAAYDTKADRLSAARRDAAERLDAAMAAELQPLKMERAVFRTDIERAEPGRDGRDAVSFTVATNPGAPSGPLSRIASGGELSRFLLALKVCLTGGETGLTLIFDEIDRGVGGATADAVGRRLRGLADGGQVLVVTHSPQVAAQGGHHWRVEKAVHNGTTLSRVAALDVADRVDEIARMLSGEAITEEARGAARALLGEPAGAR